jgi:hypothetical protein
MNFKVPLFGEVFVTTLDWPFLENFWSHSVLFRLMDSQSILSSEILRAECAMEEWWSDHDPP